MSTPQTEIPKRTGAAIGAFYEGLLVMALGGPDRKTFAIFAGDIETLRDVWSGVATGPLDEELVQKVAIFSRSAVSESRSSVNG